MQQKSISIGLFILSMLGAYLLLSMLTIFVNNSAHGDSTISESGLKESFSESALLVESLPKPCEPHEEGKVCIGLYFDSSDHVTTSILTADGNVAISGSGEAQTSEAKQSSGAASMADEKANKSDRRAHVSSEQDETTETTSQKSSDKIESPCVYVANNLYDHDTNDEDELIYSSDQELTDDHNTEYVWIDADQPDIKDEHFGNREDGVCVELYRDNGDGIADPSDDMFVGFTLMMDNSRSESESYQFTNLPDGDYFAKFYPFDKLRGAEGSKSEKVIKTPTPQARSGQYPTPSTTIDIENNTLNEKKANDNNNLTSSSNTTNRNTQAQSQYDTQSHSQSSTDNSNVNHSSAPAGSNSNTTEYNHNNGVEANRSDDNYSASTEYNEQNRENSHNITASPAAKPTAEVIYEPTAEVIYEPTAEVIYEPTAEVIYEPTAEVIYEPTAEVIYEPTAEPIYEPTAEVIYEPTAEPIYEPTAEPIYEPTAEVIYEPTAEPIYEPTAEVIYEPTAEVIYEESSDYESQDATNQSTTDTSNTDSERAVDSTNQNSANKPLSSIQIQINPSNPDSSLPSTSGEENPTSNENESVDEGTNSESNNEVHQFQPARSDSESTPYPAPDESSSSSEGSLSPTTGLRFSIGREVGSDPAPTDDDTTP